MKKLPALLICLYFCMCFPAHAQTDNTFYVKNFPGSTVGQKTIAAQSACEANPAVPCIIVFDPTLATYSQGSMPAKCAQCVWKDYRTLGGNTAVNAISLTTKAPRVDITYPDFSLGQPIASISVTNGACTSAPTITIPAPAETVDGSQAAAHTSCVNGQTIVIMDAFGGGYLPSQVSQASISGGGTSGATLSLNLMGSPGAADPTGTNDSTAAIQNAVDFALANASLSGGPQTVRIPNGKYKLTSQLYLPCGIKIAGDGVNATVLEETNDHEGVSVYASEPQVGQPFTCGGGISQMTLLAPGGHEYTASMLQVIGTTGYKVHDLRLTGGGGVGLLIASERMHFYNLTFDQVRKPIATNGAIAANENLFTNVSSNGAGEALDGYCFGANCPNGNYPPYSWSTGSTIASAVGNGSTATFVVNCNTACGEGSGVSPIGAGAWFRYSGDTNLTALNGIWQVASVSNNTPSAGQFTITTEPLETGTFTVGPDDMPMILSPAAVSVSGTSTGTSSATFQPVIWPQQDPAYEFVNDTETQINRSSIKANWFTGGIQFVDPSQDKVSNVYSEGFPENNQPHANTDFGVGGYLPYTNITSAFSATNCNPLTPCPVPVVSSGQFFNQVNNVIDMPLGVEMDLVCPDYDPSSSSACAANSAIKQDQYEIVSVQFTPDGNAQILERGFSGSTVTGVTWPAGSHLGWAAGDSTSSLYKAQSPGLLMTGNHLQGYDAPGAQWYLYTDNDTPFVAYSTLAGTVPDGVMHFTAGPKEGIVYPQYVVSVNNNTYFGIDLTAAISDDEPLLNGKALSGTDLNNGNFAVGGMSAVFIPYGNGYLSTGIVTDLMSGSRFEQGCATTEAVAAGGCQGAIVKGTLAGDSSLSSVLSPGSDSLSYAPFREVMGGTPVCSYVIPNAGSHATSRWCTATTGITYDTWSGSAWVNQMTLPTSGPVSGPAFTGGPSLAGNNTWTGTNQFGSSTSHITIDNGGQITFVGNGSTLFSVSSAGNGSVLGGWYAAQFFVSGGSQMLYRCTGTTDAGLVVAGTAGQTACGGASNATAIGFEGN